MSKSSQLETWSKYQQLDILTDTYNSVKSVLASFKVPEKQTYEDPYLQGSYANNTSIYSKGDIDIVVELSSAFRSNLTDSARMQGGFVEARYKFEDFNQDLYEYLLQNYKDDFVIQGNKTIKIKENGNRRPVDVVSAIKYRLYTNGSDYKSKYFEGISIQAGIVNFPKIHKENGKKKMTETGNNYKKYIRIFKNFKKRLELDIPSYYIECLLYNVPSEYFLDDLCQGFENVTDYLLTDSTEMHNFLSQNGLVNLFGDFSTQWSMQEARKFILECKTEYGKL